MGEKNIGKRKKAISPKEDWVGGGGWGKPGLCQTYHLSEKWHGLVHILFSL